MSTDSISKLEKLVAGYRQAARGQADLKKYTCYAITYHSTAIEGSTLTEGQVYSLLDQDIPAKNKPFAEQQMVVDHHKALAYTLNKATENAPITELLIREIGGMVVKNTGSIYNTALGTFDSARGDYRLVNVHAGARLFPDFSKVPALMKTLVKDMANRQATAKTFKEKCEAAFYAHYQFVSIHPFADGNGRTSRLLMNYILTLFDLPVFFVFKSSRISYIMALEKARKTGNLQPFYDFMFRQYKKFLEAGVKGSVAASTGATKGI
ncbi:MAG: Fic family protein [Prevotellaceae bacterium]|jgi:Fic family protein|nr:Fic family protein [Prevotellaceae bacterium]